MLTPRKESYDQTRQHIKKQRHYFVDKGLSSQSYFFPVVMYGYESWTIKKAEHWKIDAFELWCWRRLLRVPWTAKRSNQSILKEINLKYSYSEYSLEGLMLKLNLQYLGHMMGRANPLEMTLMLGNIEGKWRMGWQRMRWLDGITDPMDMSLSKLQELVMEWGSLACCTPWSCKESDVTEHLNGSDSPNGLSQIVQAVQVQSGCPRWWLRW